MKVQSIQSNTNFKAQKRFLTETQKKDVLVLIEKMSKDKSYKSNGVFFELAFTNKLIMDKAEFVGTELSSERKGPIFDKVHFTVDKTKLVIDSRTGEIEKSNKPFFTRWSKIMKNIDNYLSVFIQNFNNQKIVKKETFKFSGMTKEAFEIFQRELEKLFENRTSNKTNL